MVQKRTNKTDVPPPIWEWVLAGLGAALVAVVLGTAVYRAATQEVVPPGFEFVVESITRSSDGYAVAFRVRNTGSETAAAVGIEGTLNKSGEAVETSQATLTYVPSNSERKGGLFFTRDPAAFEMKIRATGYETP